MTGERALIISRSYLLRSGLKPIVEETGQNVEVLHSDDEHIPENIQPDFIFLDPVTISFQRIEKGWKNIPNKNRPKIIIVYFTLPRRYTNYPYLLDLSQPKSHVQQKLRELLNASEVISDDNELNAPLSNREINILRLVSLGNTNKEIAEKLFISIHTVITHRRNITRKLGIKTVSGLTVYAILNNIISPEDLQQFNALSE